MGWLRCRSGIALQRHRFSVQKAATIRSPCVVFMEIYLLVLLQVSSCIISIVEGLPFPAPNLDNCLEFETCCTPILSIAKPTAPIKFKFQTYLPRRIRPAAHLVDDAYIAKYQRAVERMKALPDTDGRSFTNQWKLHCLYCDNHLYFENETHPYPLEIHKSWLFYPWHRLFVYFHERILARLIDDDTFALPFWNWDNQSPELPQGNVVPKVYAEKRSLYADCINTTSSLYDETRNPCALLPEGMVSFQNPESCPARANASEVRASNAHATFVQVVGVGVTPLLFHGGPYRLGDEGGGGSGAMEVVPHGTVHHWVNQKKMVSYRDSAADPIFFAHHANMDRLWEVWKTLPGGIRKDVSDPDYLNTEFTFYDENGGLVTVSVAQALQLDLLGYKYQEVANPWLANGAAPGNFNIVWKMCNSEINSRGKIAALIANTKPLQDPVNFTMGPLTFKVERNPNCSSEYGEEMLEVIAEVDNREPFAITAYAFHPEASIDESFGCGEYLGNMGSAPHRGMSPTLRQGEFVMRIGIRRQLELIGMEHEASLVVTLTGSAENLKSILITGARVIYSKE
ncbi:hypothetical protein M758_6G101900 [Ceratodon purpureus]|nr:hypothetical protein M758_6G101900 [Ceratodon purpureus]